MNVRNSPLHSGTVTRRLLLAVIVAALAAGLAGCGGGPDTSTKSGYVKANENLFKKLPGYPDAKVDAEGTTTYTGAASSLGYETRFELKLPAEATAKKVTSFFTSNLQPDWKIVAQLTGPVVNFRKGDAFVSINMTNTSKHRLEVTVDQGFFTHTG